MQRRLCPQDIAIRISTDSGVMHTLESARLTITWSRLATGAVEEGRAFLRAPATLHGDAPSGASKRAHQSAYRCVDGALSGISCVDVAAFGGRPEFAYLPRTSRISNDHFVTQRGG